ncbi:MAG: hypothetical protein CL844_01580 [Crocinitomicaceae bacterium]|nr:hypothetical protein [Crocinitomicaceae bacterium]
MELYKGPHLIIKYEKENSRLINSWKSNPPNDEVYQDLSNQNSPIEINLSMLPAGLYFVKVVNGQNNNISFKKIIKMD